MNVHSNGRTSPPITTANDSEQENSSNTRKEVLKEPNDSCKNTLFFMLVYLFFCGCTS
ncbi:hypothetical protein M6B38_397970 [Iris pallida]|uniref:Uncharacterized protein n=1 Tax=Iris pallida TaxID=29817 RepID=A0AAX6FUY4_IRIPA|nr:hypothetical protein M6B38_397970 [Iris pallida]